MLQPQKVTTCSRLSQDGPMNQKTFSGCLKHFLGYMGTDSFFLCVFTSSCCTTLTPCGTGWGKINQEKEGWLWWAVLRGKRPQAVMFTSDISFTQSTCLWYLLSVSNYTCSDAELAEEKKNHAFVNFTPALVGRETRGCDPEKWFEELLLACFTVEMLFMQS